MLSAANTSAGPLIRRSLNGGPVVCDGTIGADAATEDQVAVHLVAIQVLQGGDDAWVERWGR